MEHKHPALLALLTLAATSMACSPTSGKAAVGAEQSADAAGNPPCKPVETREPNASGQRPTVAGQTPPCAVKSNVAFDVTGVARGLEHPWAVEPLPGGDLLVTERPGRMRVVPATGQVGQPIANLPKVATKGEGGLVDVALSHSFDSDRTIYGMVAMARTEGNES